MVVAGPLLLRRNQQVFQTFPASADLAELADDGLQPASDLAEEAAFA